MKYIALFGILLLMAVPSFAATVNLVPNPSYELTRPQNVSLPLDWYQCNDFDDYCVSDVLAWKVNPPRATEAWDGSFSLNLSDDVAGQAVDSVGTGSLGYNLTGQYNFSVVWKTFETGENFPIFWLRDRFTLSYWYFELTSNNGSLTGTQCILVNSTDFQVPFDCINENLTGGWIKTSFPVNFLEPFNPHFNVEYADGDSVADYMLVDNVSLTYEGTLPAACPVSSGIQDPSFECTQPNSYGGRLNPFNAIIPEKWFTDYNFARAMYYDDINWSNPANGENIHASGSHYFSGTKSLEFNITDMSIWGSNNFGVSNTGGFNLTAANNYQLTYYIEKTDTFQETDPCPTSGGSMQYVAVPVLRDTTGNNQIGMYICNSTSVADNLGSTLFFVNSFSYQNVTGADGHQWQKWTLDFNLTANTENITLTWYSSILGSANFTYFADDVAIQSPSPPAPPTPAVTGATGIVVNSVIVIFALVVAIVGFLMLTTGAKGMDTKLIVTGFIVMLMGVVFALIMFGAVN